MAYNRNTKLNDEAMAKANGGKLEPGQEGATIKGRIQVSVKRSQRQGTAASDDDRLYGQRGHQGLKNKVENCLKIPQS